MRQLNYTVENQKSVIQISEEIAKIYLEYDESENIPKRILEQFIKDSIVKSFKNYSLEELQFFNSNLLKLERVLTKLIRNCYKGKGFPEKIVTVIWNVNEKYQSRLFYLLNRPLHELASIENVSVYPDLENNNQYHFFIDSDLFVQNLLNL